MALKSTIYKADLQLADLDRHVYADYPLTLARHPSETEERLMVRIVAFGLHAHERLAFGPGLSDADEPCLWQRDLTGAIERWIEVGLPDERHLARACGRADEVVVIAYGRGMDVWWKNIASSLTRLRNLVVLRLPEDGTQALAALVQ
ncbi:MAG TPA: YaeQ family protein, partial [Burkholderiaceae bacterium]|nr:YaeQ family protein [Burkholderiaceae bacterium]